ncbi:SPRY domain-containing SOCS box protein 3 isoform X2 [Cylas formicarius]|uniref:SPRY domain-containing SOCS box protein 3 isoform X2 n=1 Tax=Cylas formicarius TaxID=197179 RepID=UPI002958BEC5|nr:SPRY domain-containing SOCS box protein 3 isoform X2 [Cylas formicarius]
MSGEFDKLYINDRVNCDVTDSSSSHKKFKSRSNRRDPEPIFDWRWYYQEEDASNIRLSLNRNEIVFHPIYSSGTAAIRGDTILKQNMHHFWEIKILTRMYGTDVMLGVGTEQANLTNGKFKFCSLLGLDKHSWGYSYHGYIQHNKLKRQYSRKFDKDRIIGMHLDMCKGTLEYYLDRRPLGIAFRDLKGLDLYPMVSSTAAKSAVRTNCCITQKLTLQLLCLQTVMQHANLYKQYRKTPGLMNLFSKRYFWLAPKQEKNEQTELARLEEEVTLSLVHRGPLLMVKRRGRHCS